MSGLSTLKTLCFVALCAFVAGPVSAQVSMDSESLDGCSDVIVVVNEEIDGDCDWSIGGSEISITGDSISVELALAPGDNTCTGGVVEAEFAINLGTLPAGDYQVTVNWVGVTSTLVRGGETTFTVETCVEEGTFKRGDVDGDGSVAVLTDALALLSWAFAGGNEPPCEDATDVDDDGVIFPLLDAYALLQWAFSSGPEPAAPGVAECGEDPTSDGIRCEDSTGCQ